MQGAALRFMRQQPHFIHAQHVLHFRNPKGRIKEGTTVEASFISYVSGIILSIFTSLVITRLVLSAFLPLTAKLDRKRPGINAKLYALKRGESVEEGK